MRATRENFEAEGKGGSEAASLGTRRRSDAAAGGVNLGYLLAKASQRWNELLYERFRARGFAEVRPSYGSVLLPLFEEDGLRMGEIAARSQLSKQTMTTLVRLTERAGLVTRQRDPDDGRAFRIHLTERARRFQPVAEEVLAELDCLVREHFSQIDLETTTDVLKGVMSLCNPEPSPPSSPRRRSESSPISRRSRTSPSGRRSSRGS